MGVERLTASRGGHLTGHRLLGAVEPSRARRAAPVARIA